MQTQPVDYFYTGSSPPASFTMNLFTVEPSICDLVYSCKQLTPSSFDFCQLGSFQPTVADITFATEDYHTVPQGTYSVSITGEITTATQIRESITVNFKLISPCETTPFLVAWENVPFMDEL